tara:strand:- start:407 stop:667 length:261 start_codon:yes stop_codon:yes gene_type:complete
MRRSKLKKFINAPPFSLVYMILQENRSIQNVGEKAGFIIGYFLFTTVLYFVLFFLKRMPVSWSYGHIMIITAVIVLIGTSIKRLLR